MMSSAKGNGQPGQEHTLALIILTYNEEANIAQALDSVAGWASQIFILDSLSTDHTLDIARRYDCQIVQHKFESYAKQRNHALEHLPIHSEWVLFLDADEWLPDSLKQEISTLIATRPEANGYYINRRLIWMGRWIRRGYHPSWILRLFRYGKGRCEDRAVNEHLIVKGATGHLHNDFMHEDRKGVTDWIAKHNGYATQEAAELLNTRVAPDYHEIDARLFGTQEQRKRWLRLKVWNRLPPVIRPFFYFFYRYILRGGFLDGHAAFTFHFLQALWYPMLIDIKYLEMKMRGKSKDLTSS
ncbi:MAG: glycosyltransferase family 2 protein [Proteobacteria bacterium]|nr:glycosyltransferase family 2 protein [Pseudomonadota bacterium]